MKYRFFSRKNGYPSLDMIAKYYYSSVINDEENITKDFVNKSGNDIIKIIENLKSKEKIKETLYNSIKKEASTYFNWYYYPADTKITEARIYI